MADNTDGHREYVAERKANLLRLAEDFRDSETLRSEFLSGPTQTATKYGLSLTEEEVSALVGIAGNQELDLEALAAVAGGSSASTNSGICINGSCFDNV